MDVKKGWFKEQKANPDHGTLSDLYTFAEGNGTLGLTQCAPIVNITGS